MLQKSFDKMAYNNLDEFIYGVSKNPVVCKNGMVIGGGRILPELNFTMPPMDITESTMPEVIGQYKGIMEDALKRARELFLTELVIELELLPPATYNPRWGIEIMQGSTRYYV